ncbi:hypothetical protein ACMT4L_16820 [Deinococcus sp. A31D244]|uniref:hypothetical protein n=1 Tax=Deinococcus sp. A31D244 TaxID=3397675 RepID=UPI0039E1119D
MTTHPTARAPARPARVRLASRPAPARAAAWSGAVMGLGFVLALASAMSPWVPGVVIGALLFVAGVRLTGRRVSRYVETGAVVWE